jgi:DNA polymerase-3 subunit epsilon
MRISFQDDDYTLEDININLQNNRFCIFDFEGTGINHQTECITQIGAIVLENSSDNIRSFCSFVKSPKMIPPEVEELTGISNVDMINAPIFSEVYKQFLDFIKGKILVTQAGYEYDVPLLERYCKEHNLDMFGNQVIDTKALFTNIHSEINEVISTDFLIDYYGIETGDLMRHNALDDCKLIGRIFQKIMDEYRKKGIKDFVITNKLKVKKFKVPSMYLYEGNIS